MSGRSIPIYPAILATFKEKIYQKNYYISKTKNRTKISYAKYECQVNSNLPCNFGHFWRKLNLLTHSLLYEVSVFPPPLFLPLPFIEQQEQPQHPHLFIFPFSPPTLTYLFSPFLPHSHLFIFLLSPAPSCDSLLFPCSRSAKVISSFS